MFQVNKLNQLLSSSMAHYGTLWHIIIHYQKQTALPEGIPCSKAAPALLSPWALQD